MIKKTQAIKVVKSKDVKLFPMGMFLWRIDDLTDNKVCWFECMEHAERYILRQQPKYKLIHYVGGHYDKSHSTK